MLLLTVVGDKLGFSFICLCIYFAAFIPRQVHPGGHSFSKAIIAPSAITIPFHQAPWNAPFFPFIETML